VPLELEELDVLLLDELDELPLDELDVVLDACDDEDETEDETVAPPAAPTLVLPTPAPPAPPVTAEKVLPTVPLLEQPAAMEAQAKTAKKVTERRMTPS
jgi:hypothetical protein